MKTTEMMTVHGPLTPIFRFISFVLFLYKDSLSYTTGVLYIVPLFV